MLKQKQSIFGATLGFALETYDYFIFLFLTRLVSEIFSDGQVIDYGRIAVNFALGYLARPIGAFLLGPMADLHGRRRLMVLAAFMVGLFTLLLAFAPQQNNPFRTSAEVFLIIFRALQGVAYGVGHSVMMVYIVELAPIKRRGLYASFSYLSQQIGMLTAVIVALMMLAWFPPDFLNRFGWRIPFLLGGLTLGVAFYMRHRTVDTPLYLHHIAKRKKTDRHPAVEVFKHYKMMMLKGFIAASVIAVGFYLYRVFVLVVAIDQGILSLFSIGIISILSGLFSMGFAVIGGYLSDIVGRKPVLIASALGSALLSWPMLVLMTHPGAPEMVFVRMLVGELIMAIFMGLYGGVLPAFFTEIFPTSVRCTAGAISFNLAMCLVAGSTPVLCIYLLKMYHTNALPGAYVSFWSLVMIYVIGKKVKETYQKELS